jgi:hypothetical protein
MTERGPEARGCSGLRSFLITADRVSVRSRGDSKDQTGSTTHLSMAYPPTTTSTSRSTPPSCRYQPRPVRRRFDSGVREQERDAVPARFIRDDSCAQRSSAPLRARRLSCQPRMRFWPAIGLHGLQAARTGAQLFAVDDRREVVNERGRQPAGGDGGAVIDRVHESDGGARRGVGWACRDRR